jgi:hypothetical protein
MGSYRTGRRVLDEALAAVWEARGLPGKAQRPASADLMAAEIRSCVHGGRGVGEGAEYE